MKKTMLYAIIAMAVIAVATLGWYYYSSVGMYTASTTNTTNTSTINVHAYLSNVTEVGATVTVIDQGFHDMGDVNWDGKIDIQDQARVSAAYGSYPGHPKWCPECDLNHDNRIDIRDVAIASKNFGNIAPYSTTPFMNFVKEGKLKLTAVYNNQTQTKLYTIYAGTTTLINFYFTPTDVKTYSCPSGTTNYSCSSGLLTCNICSTNYTTKIYNVTLMSITYKNMTNGTVAIYNYYIIGEFAGLTLGESKVLKDGTIFGVTSSIAFYLQSSYEIKPGSVTMPPPSSTAVNLIVSQSQGCRAVTNSCPSGYTSSCSGSILTCIK